MVKKYVIGLLILLLGLGWWLYGTWWPDWFQNMRAEQYARSLEQASETLLVPLGDSVGLNVVEDLEKLRQRAFNDFGRGRLTANQLDSVERVCQRLRRVSDERRMFEQGAAHIRTRQMESLQNADAVSRTRSFFVAQNIRQWNELADYHRAHVRHELRNLTRTY